MRKIITVLYVCIDPTLGGSTLSLFELIESVRDSVYPIVLFPQKGSAYDHFVDHGIECLVYPFVNLYRFKQNKLKDIWNHPWRWHPIKKWRNDVGCVLFIKKMLKGRKIDIVHTNTSPNDVGVYISRFFKAKHVWHVRECLSDHAQFEIYGGMERLIRKINQADARIVVSSYLKDRWKMVDKNTYRLCVPMCSSKEDVICVLPKEKYVLFVSYNLTEAKGSRTAIQAFGMSGLFDEGYKLVLIGNCSADYKSSLMETAKEYRCDQEITFLPCQSNLKPFYAKASALIMASKYEGYGRVTAEAMSYGCPVIGHASGGTLDLVQDGKTGYLFNDTAGCARLLRVVCLTDQETIIRQAQHFVLENSDLNSYGLNVLNIYFSVLHPFDSRVK